MVAVSGRMKSGSEDVAEWIWKVCLTHWKNCRVSDNWTMTVMITRYKGKVSTITVRITWKISFTST